MTNEEKKEQMDKRNADICAYYAAGHKLVDVSSKFGLGRQRVQQILETAGVWKPYAKSPRNKFLGVVVTEETKEKLKAAAEAEGVSVSAYTSDVLDAAVGGGPQ